MQPGGAKRKVSLLVFLPAAFTRQDPQPFLGKKWR